jgi:ribosomal protein S18 acetylase RimI-like enzyme
VGAILVEAALERARTRRCRRIELDVNEANAPALALYERFGFSAHTKHGAGRDLFLGREIEPIED